MPEFLKAKLPSMQTTGAIGRTIVLFGALLLVAFRPVSTAEPLSGSLTNLLWKYPMSVLRDTPTVDASGRVYFARLNLSPVTESQVVCLNTNGDVRWVRTITDQIKHGVVIDERGGLLLGTSSGAESWSLEGDLLWRLPLPMDASWPITAPGGPSVYNHPVGLSVVRGDGSSSAQMSGFPAMDVPNHSVLINGRYLVMPASDLLIFDLERQGALVAAYRRPLCNTFVPNRTGRLFGSNNEFGMVAVSLGGVRIWADTNSASMSNYGAQPSPSPILDAEGNIYALVVPLPRVAVPVELRSYRPDGTVRWSRPIKGTFQFAFTPVLDAAARIHVAIGTELQSFATDDGRPLRTVVLPETMRGAPLLTADGRWVLTGSANLMCLVHDVSFDRDAQWPMHRGSLGQGAFQSVQLPKPGPVEKLSAESYVGFVSLRWKSSAELSSTEVWRGSTSNFSDAARLAEMAPFVTRFDDTNTVRGETRYYWVITSNSSGVSRAGPVVGGQAPVAVRWRYPLGGDSFFGLAISGTNIVASGYYSAFVGMTLSGIERWRVDIGQHVLSPVALGRDGTAYIRTEANLKAISALGVALWEVPAGEMFGPRPSSVAIASDGRLVLMTRQAIQVHAPTGKLLWSKPVDPGSGWPVIDIHGSVLGGVVGGESVVWDLDGQEVGRNTHPGVVTLPGSKDILIVVAPNATNLDRLYWLRPDGTVLNEWKGYLKGFPLVLPSGELWASIDLPRTDPEFVENARALGVFGSEGNLLKSIPGTEVPNAVAADGTVLALEGKQLTAFAQDGRRLWSYEHTGLGGILNATIANDGSVVLIDSVGLTCLETDLAPERAGWPLSRGNLRATANAADSGYIQLGYDRAGGDLILRDLNFEPVDLQQSVDLKYWKPAGGNAFLNGAYGFEIHPGPAYFRGARP